MNKRGLIGSIIVIGILLVVGFFWFVGEIGEENMDVMPVSLANPASGYCIEQGHELRIEQDEDGSRGVCVSPDGQKCEEWLFFRGACDFLDFDRCVAASCCHAVSCVWESEAPDCREMLCTMSCEEGTMDCGAGRCGVVDGVCEVVWVLDGHDSGEPNE